MSRYPEARWVPAGTPGGAITPRVVILHTEATAGKAAPHDGLEWHFWIANDGSVDQLVDTNRRADANNLANRFAISVETEDDGSPDADPWTPAQVDAIVALCRWTHEEHGIPLRRCDRWDGSGIGHHTMFGAPSQWTPYVKSCPGAARKAQFESEILPRLARAEPSPEAEPASKPPATEVPPMTFIHLIYPSPDQFFAIGPTGTQVPLTAAQAYELGVGGAKFIRVQQPTTWHTLKKALV